MNQSNFKVVAVVETWKYILRLSEMINWDTLLICYHLAVTPQLSLGWIPIEQPQIRIGRDNLWTSNDHHLIEIVDIK